MQNQNRAVLLYAPVVAAPYNLLVDHQNRTVRDPSFLDGYMHERLDLFRMITILELQS